MQAGKGRTGLMVCAYLVYNGMSAEEALQLYAQRRTMNNEGVSHLDTGQTNEMQLIENAPADICRKHMYRCNY